MSPLPERLGRYQVIRTARNRRVRHGLSCPRRRAGAAGGDQGPPGQLLRSPEQVESFLAEARMAAGLGHPAIVAVHDVGRNGENGVFVVFEYVEGRNLAEILEAERLSPSQIAQLLVPVAEAAHYAITRGWSTAT